MNQPNKERFKTSVGGQALMEGIMMRGPKNICCAVRKPDCNLQILLQQLLIVFAFFCQKNIIQNRIVTAHLITDP